MGSTDPIPITLDAGVGLQVRIQGVALRQRERVRALAEACVFVALTRVDGV